MKKLTCHCRAIEAEVNVSEKGFAYRDALAILPEDESTIAKKGRDNKHFSDAGAAKISDAFVTPVKERNVTQQERQIAFDNQETTDDIAERDKRDLSRKNSPLVVPKGALMLQNNTSTVEELVDEVIENLKL